MSQSAPSWDLFNVFLVVMQEGSLSAAARALRTTQPTVRRAIEALERALGEVLFTRSPSGLTPTDAAHRVLPYAAAMGASANALVRMMGEEFGEALGTVRISCSAVIGVEVLPPILAKVMGAHPGLEIELTPTNRVEDLLRRDRMTRPSQAALVATKIGAITLGLHAASAYLERRGVPKTLEDVIEHHLLIGEDRGATMKRALEEMLVGKDPPCFAYRTDDDLAQLAAIRAGIGVGVCQVGLASRGVDLQRVLPDFEFALETWVVMHEDLRGSPRTRLVFDHLVDGLRAYVQRR
jgi:DNA-binding transcriptional LysR family regulator